MNLRGTTSVNFLESVPAIRRIETDRADVFAVDIVGHVTAADAENLFGLLEAAYALHPRVDVLVRLVDHDGVDWQDIDPETLEHGTADAAMHVVRCATIGDPDWTGHVTGFFADPPPTDIRHFAAEDEAAAWAWLGAHEKPAEV